MTPRLCGLKSSTCCYKMVFSTADGKMSPKVASTSTCNWCCLVLTALHSDITAGHLDIAKTLNKVRARFYWPGQRRDVEDWCQACDECGSRKPLPRPCHAPLQPELAGRPLQRVAMDILGPLPETDRGHKYVLVIADYFTKWTEALPMPDMEARTVANLFSPVSLCVDLGHPTIYTLIRDETSSLFW